VKARDNDPPLALAADEFDLAVPGERPELIVADAAEKAAGLDDGDEEGSLMWSRRIATSDAGHFADP
jgi:hypothetical protein